MCVVSVNMHPHIILFQFCGQSLFGVRYKLNKFVMFPSIGHLDVTLCYVLLNFGLVYTAHPLGELWVTIDGEGGVLIFQE